MTLEEAEEYKNLTGKCFWAFCMFDASSLMGREEVIQNKHPWWDNTEELFHYSPKTNTDNNTNTKNGKKSCENILASAVAQSASQSAASSPATPTASLPELPFAQ
jgi:hypothetical protein